VCPRAKRILTMVPCGQCVRLSVTMLALFAAAAPACRGESKRKPDPDPGPPPTVRIEVGHLGYVSPSRAYLSYRYSTTTLDFIDNDHLLFTFRDASLMHRIPDDPPDDEDQTIRAEVLDVATGKEVEESQWRMHDRQRYLWPLRDGRFIVRQRNSLYLTDSHLELRPYLQFDTPLQLVQISPDRNLMVIEVQKIVLPDPDAPKTSGLDSFFGPPPKPKRTRMVLVHPGDNTVLAESETRHPVDVPMVENGYLNLLEGKDPSKWVMQRELLRGDPQVIAEVKSSCMPTLMTLSDNVALAVGCPPKGGNDHLVSAISLKGDVLWQDRWKARYIWPTFDYAEDGSRFACGSLQINRDIGSMDFFGQEDVVAQMVGVFDTESGKLELTKDASPVLSAGHNYALSSNGRRFAILREGAIEIYDLPPVAAAAPSNVAAK
jgi:hypothetical protein